MRKFLFSALAAMGLVLASQQTAPAWINCQFGAGFNWQWQSGGNNFLWGAFRNGAANQDPFGGGHHAYFAPAPVDYGFAAPAPTPIHSSLGVQPQATPVSLPAYYPMPQYFYPVSGSGW